MWVPASPGEFTPVDFRRQFEIIAAMGEQD